MINYRTLVEVDAFDELLNMTRWNGMRRIKDESVGTHSYVVSYLVRLMSEEIFSQDTPKLLATTYAIFHDNNETITGDVNHNVKYNDFNGSKIRTLLNEYIDNTVDEIYPKNDSKINHLLNGLLKEEIPIYIKKLVKLADWMSMVMYLKKEISLGNQNLYEKLIYCDNELENAKDNLILELNLQTDWKIDCSILN